MRLAVQAQLSLAFPVKLVEELLDAHSEAKRNYYLGGLRLSEVEGGRFCEACFRMLEHIAFGGFTAIGTPLDSEKIIHRLENIPKGSHTDSIRLHIPRALRLVYDIRNKRDAAHLADGIDPNLQDSILVISVIDWVLAELVRLYHKVPPNEAQEMVEGIVTRSVPIIQDFDGFLKILNPELSASAYCLVILYERDKNGAVYDEIEKWVRAKMRKNLSRTLNILVDEKAFLHREGNKFFITRLGQKEVESKHLLGPAT